ncbi:choice-of-anchor G family protein, partial [Glutamicibacter sp. NPDC127525]|uniref:choice-of-anchor G family protein n=1 Tax=unclassified Glutamicibacter TaxID=2627139 RepID=UPI00363DA8C1
MNQKTPALSRKKGAGTVALGTTAAVVFGSLLCAPPAIADTVETDAVSAAHGHGIFVEGLGLDVVGSAKADSEFPDNVGSNGNDLDVAVLDALNLNLGSLSLPLIKGSEAEAGLLHLGNLGALSSYAISESETTSTASAGILGENGALNVDADPGNGTDPSKINLTDLLSQVLTPELVNTVLDEASITIGALGSSASEDAGVVTSEYAVADLQADISSPLVGGLATEVNTALETLIEPVSGLLATGGAVETLVSGLVDTLDAIPLVNGTLNDLSLDTEPLLTSVRTELLATPLENSDGSVSVNLTDGTIHVDLAQLIMDSTGATDLNSLPANTSVLSGDVVTSIVDGVSDALIGAGPNSLVSKTVALVTEGLYSLELNVDIQVAVDSGLPLVPPLVNAPVTINGTLGGFLGQEGHTQPVVDASNLTVAGLNLGAALQPILDGLNGLVTSIGGALEPVTDEVIAQVGPTLTTTLGSVISPLLDDALAPVLSQLVGITINEQPTEGDLGADSFTVRALALDVLPGTANLGVDLGSSTIKALDEAPVAAAVDILTPAEGQEVPAGDVVVTGTGEPGADVTVAIPGQPDQLTTVLEDGTWSVTFPNVPGGDHTATATDENASTDVVNFVVVENTDVNTADNTAENTDVNTAENTDVNTAENTDVNTAENTDVNTAENTDV